jgi:hypothetical protein
MRFSIKANTPTDVQIVSAKLGPNGFTGWHSATGCAGSVINAGLPFTHPEGAHNFVNTARLADGTPIETEFYIVYFIPADASPAPIDGTPAPAGCPA